MNITANMPSCRRSRASACSSRSMSMMRFGRLVSESCSTWCSSCASNAFCSVRLRKIAEMTGSEPSTLIELAETIAGKRLPSRRTPVSSISRRSFADGSSRKADAANAKTYACSSGGTIAVAERPKMSSARHPNIASAAALKERIVPSAETVRIPSAAFSTTARWCASLRRASSRLRCASSRATAARLVSSASSCSASSFRSPMAPDSWIEMAQTNAPRAPMPCACAWSRNDGATPTNTNSCPVARPISDHPSEARHAPAPD